eukprot:GHVN01029756.1.p1 GENE.GHVN01029756.1~~GHVN01029756.1.p1  ORF type:complete len:677 (-),score=103.73 GHVN01029756.1:29-2059(-)
MRGELVIGSLTLLTLIGSHVSLCLAEVDLSEVDEDIEYVRASVHFIIANEPFVETHSTALEDFLTFDLKAGTPKGVPKDSLTFLEGSMRSGSRSPDWTLLPLLYTQRNSTAKWVFVATSFSRVDMNQLGKFLKAKEELWESNVPGKNTGKKNIFGVGLLDGETRSIIHHFKQDEFMYPLLSSGVIFSTDLINSLPKKSNIDVTSFTFSIDPVYEMMKFIKLYTNVTLTDAREMCVEESNKSYLTRSDIAQSCVSWTDTRLNQKYRHPTPISLAEVPWNREIAPKRSVDYLESLPFDAYDILLLVKTTQKLRDRIIFQHDLWAAKMALPPAQRIVRVADTNDHFISPGTGMPIVLIDAEVSEQTVGYSHQPYLPSPSPLTYHHNSLCSPPSPQHGHCSKMVALLKYATQYYPTAKFYVILDDDTHFNMRGLFTAIANTFLKNDASAGDKYVQGGRPPSPPQHALRDRSNLTIEHTPDKHAKGIAAKLRRRVSPLYMGERYGFQQLTAWVRGTPLGYDYITTGGGLVLDNEAVRLLQDCRTCRCRAPDAPDDMTLGGWFKTLNVSSVHWPGFHQANPKDYHPLIRAMEYGRRTSFHRIKNPNEYHFNLAESHQEGKSDDEPHPYSKELNNFLTSRYKSEKAPNQQAKVSKELEVKINKNKTVNEVTRERKNTEMRDEL